MRAGEHRQMAVVEDHHFWYRGLRDVLVRTLARRGLPPNPRVLDAGCGTGANLRALAEAFAPSYLGGFDLSEEALEHARVKAPAAALHRADIREPVRLERDLDLVVCLDVIYIAGAEACLPGLATLVEALAPSGLFVLEVPAYEWLRSPHDVAVGGTERFTAGRVRRLFEQLGLEVELLTYRLCALLPLVVLRRLPGMIAPPIEPRSELHTPPGPRLDEALWRAIAVENRLIARDIAMPWGSSVFAIGRRA